MEFDELKSMWQARESGMANTARINSRLLEEIEAQKVRSTIKPFLLENIVVISLHLVVIAGLFVFLFYHISDTEYTVSALVMIGYYFFLTVNTGRQIRELRSIDQGKDLAAMQTSLTRLRTHRLDFIRLSVLTIPAFLSFPVVIPRALNDLNIDVFTGFDIIKQTHGTWWVAEIMACLVLIPMGVWFYQQVRPQNIHKTWVRALINKTTGKNVQKAILYLNELEAAKTEERH